MLRALPKNKACGLDGVSARLLKEADTIIAPSPTNLFNLSVRTGIFPRDRKLTKVTPIYKDDKKKHSLKKTIFKKLYSYLTEHGVISDSQLGFRPYIPFDCFIRCY